jgi:hypothetical protein
VNMGNDLPETMKSGEFRDSWTNINFYRDGYVLSHQKTTVLLVLIRGVLKCFLLHVCSLSVSCIQNEFEGMSTSPHPSHYQCEAREIRESKTVS